LAKLPLQNEVIPSSGVLHWGLTADQSLENFRFLGSLGPPPFIKLYLRDLGK